MGRRVADAVGVQHRALQRGLQERPQQLGGDAREKAQVRHLRTAGALEGEWTTRGRVQDILVDRQLDAGPAQRGIVGRLEGLEAGRAHFGRTVAAQELVTDQQADLRHQAPTGDQQAGDQVLASIVAQLTQRDL